MISGNRNINNLLTTKIFNNGKVKQKIPTINKG